MNNHWIQCKLKDIATWGSGGTPSRNNPENFKDGCIPWIKSGELKEKYLYNTEEKISVKATEKSSAKIFSKNSVAIAMYGATIGNISILGIDAATNQAVAVANVDQSKITSEFLYYYLLSQQKILARMGQGGAQPNISQQILKEFSFGYPDLKTQKKIVAKLDALFAEIDTSITEINSLKKQLESYKESVLNATFNVNYPKVEIGEIADPINGKTFKSSEWAKQGFPIIRIQNLKNSNAPYNHFDGFLEEKYKVNKGDLLFAWSGTPGTSFGAFIWNGQIGALNQHIFKLHVNAAKVNKKYLYYVLNYQIAGFIEHAQGGVGLAHITKSKFIETIIPLPDKTIQDSIANKLDVLFTDINSSITAINSFEQSIILLRQSILKQAFEGKLV